MKLPSLTTPYEKSRYIRVSTESSILACKEGEFSWIRCEGKGSFQNSPAMKEQAERNIKSGHKNIVIDLEKCLGMDSTFMGTMAGIAMRLMKIPDAKLQVAAPGERNRQSLEDLGLDAVMEIDPEDGSWDERLTKARALMKPCVGKVNGRDKAPHVLDAHKKLCEIDDRNTEKFATVLDFLEADVNSKKAGDK